MRLIKIGRHYGESVATIETTSDEARFIADLIPGGDVARKEWDDFASQLEDHDASYDEDDR